MSEYNIWDVNNNIINYQNKYVKHASIIGVWYKCIVSNIK